MKKFISDKENYMFSSFSNDDIKEYFNFLKNYYIDYRKKLGLDKELSFGMEFEYEGYIKNKVDSFVSNMDGYKSVKEKDFENDTGGEIITPPLKDTKKTWDDVKKICECLKENKAITSRYAGAHVHINADLLDDLENLKKLILLYSGYENIIYGFSNGERLVPRGNQLAAAYPISLFYIYNMKNILESHSFVELRDNLMPLSREHGLNLTNYNFFSPSTYEYKNTIEFRMANGTKEEVIWQNLCNTYAKLVSTCKNKELDMDKLLDRISKFKNKKNYAYFGRLDYRGALEFADIIFDNNLDKSNFLRQYFKDFIEMSIHEELHNLQVTLIKK